MAGPTAIVVALLAGLFLWLGGSSPAQDDAAVPVFIAEEGPLTISVAENASIRAREQVILKSEVEGQTTIIYLVPEGTRVKQDDLLVELDASALHDERIEEEIDVQNAEAGFIRARETLEVVKNQAAADISRAELDYRFAQEDIRMYMAGEYPKKRKEVDSRITLAEEELKRATDKAEGSRTLYEEKYISLTELQADELAMKKALLDLELAKGELTLLETYTHQRSIDELNSLVEQTQMALERARRKASADVLQAEADLRAKQADFKQQQDQLAKALDQISKSKIYAPREGLVVYASSTRANWRGNDQPLEEGQQVRERQELIYLPTADEMMAQVKIQEASLDIVKVGMAARITVDALPGRRFTGRVVRIAPLPDASSAWMNPDLKVYDTDIHLIESDPALRTGMNCTVEIVAAHYEKTLYVPVQAVVRHGMEPNVYVRSVAGFQPRPVELGLDNNRLVRIVKGLSAGEIVSLAPPLQAAAVEAIQIAGLPPAMTEAEVRATVPERPRRSSEAGEQGPRGGGAAGSAGGTDASRRGESGGEAGSRRRQTDEDRADRPAVETPKEPSPAQQTAPQRPESVRQRMQSGTAQERDRTRESSRQRRPRLAAGAEAQP
jgi:HlyD family secretion protein